MNDEELLQAIKAGFVQAKNGYYISKEDFDKFKYALQVLNNISKQYQDLDDNGRLDQ